MPTTDPSAYTWVTRDSSYSSAGCLTVVTGHPLERALALAGADLDRMAPTSDGFTSEGMAALAGALAVHGEPAVLLVEDNGYEGSRPEVLKALSRKGVAASAYWNVNGVVRFGCARRGKLVYTTELPDGELDVVPRVLRQLAAGAEAEDADLVATAVAMVVAYTGVEVRKVDEVSRPTRFHPVVSPVLGLPVTAEELAGLQYPTPELVAAARAASSETCRRLAKWAALDAVEAADLREHPAIAPVLDQLADYGGPVALGSGFIGFRHEVARALDIASDAIQYANNSHTTPEERDLLMEEIRMCGRRHWAVQALLYVAVRDSMTAALGATYCATVQRGLRTEAAARFHQQALEIIT